jgi:hypothetical protein
MSIPKNITNEHIDRVINEMNIDNIPKGRLSNTYFLISGEKRLPPKYVLSEANKYANNEILSSDSFNAVEAVAFLRKLNYEIEESNNMVNIKLYDIHGTSTIENFRTLITPDDKYFYWDSKRFTRNEIGDIVFWVNRTERIVLYSIIDSMEVRPSFSNGRNLINDLGYDVSATAKDATQFETFYRFKIIEKAPMPDGWNYSNPVPFNGQTMAIILYEPNVNEPEKKIEKINDLSPIFINNEEITEILIEALALLSIKEKKIYKSVMEKFREYMYTIHKNRTTSDDYMKMMPKIEAWLINNGVVVDEFKIWEEVKLINSINEKLSTTFKTKWKELNKNESNWYSSPWNLWTKFNKMNILNDDSDVGINSKKMETPKEIIKHAHEFITNSGFNYQYDEIANFYLALRAKPFVILAGISGTGKTQLPRKFAASLGFSKKQIIQLPVRPDWTDSSDLLGYTSLEGNFIPKDLTLAIQKAILNPDEPYFFILDEMNLARVEHYFSDYLSVIETRERVGNEIKTDPILREEILKTAKNKNDFSEIGLPQNLYLIGTVNMDETTHAFSKKVLDRANSIEMNEVDLNWITNNGKSLKKLENISNDLFKTVYLHSIDLSEVDKKSISDEMILLHAVNKILEKADLHFAYRVRDEIAFYLILNKSYKLMKSNTAFDFQLVQKILPRIHGSSERVQTVLVELLNLLESKDFRSSSFEFSMLNGKIDIDNLKYKKTSKKIIFMLKRFDDDRFTSFWL